jgi:hypothetical protein
VDCGSIIRFRRIYADLMLRCCTRGRLLKRVLCPLFLAMLMAAPSCRGSDLVFLRSAGDQPPEQSRLAVAARFYGLNLTVITLDGTNNTRALEAVRAKSTLGVAIEANVLAGLSQPGLSLALHRMSGNTVPLLIVGVMRETDAKLLRAWSGSAVNGVNRINVSGYAEYAVGRVPGVTQELSGIELPFPAEGATTFALSGKGQTQEVLLVHSGNALVPILIEAAPNGQQVFLLGALGAGANTDMKDVVHAFAAVAPEMIFVKYAAGDRGWHFPGHFANFTIDDPWLREPYGNLNYKGLLAEMDKHNFHTTIAFIPWNYDRSEAAVVSLFRDHPNRFSICVHGDNHDHKEFESFRSKPLSVQVADLKQGLARMAAFEKRTGIPFDRVFVFPHSIGEAPILEKLKEYNFLATVNSTDVPMESAAPAGLLFELRPVTTAFADFPSVLRYPANMPNPTALIAISDFLGNPLFFYTHQEFFSHGIDAFDPVADSVNRLEPDTRWTSLSDIASHLYLIRSGDDGDDDVFSFSSSVQLRNPSTSAQVYQITKREPDASAIESVTVDGTPAAFKVDNGLLSCTLTIPAGQTRSLLVTYKNDLNLASINIRKSSLKVYLLREASDFRDIWLSRFGPGQAAIAYYYNHNESPTRVLIFVAVILILMIGAAWIGIRSFKGRRSGSSAIRKVNP